MDDLFGVLTILWCLITIVYSGLAALWGDGYWYTTRKAILIAKHSKQFNIIGKITVVPIYTIVTLILLLPSCICYSIFSILAFCVPYILAIFLKVEDNND